MAFGLDHLPTTLTFNPSPAKVKFELHPKIKVLGQTVETGELGQTHRSTDRRTDGRYQVHYLPALRSLKIILRFPYFPFRHDEYQYLEALEQIIKHGVEKGDRTGVGTRSIFGMQFRYSLRDGKS